MKYYVVFHQGGKEHKIELPADFVEYGPIFASVKAEPDWEDVNPLPVNKDYMLGLMREYYPGRPIEAIKLVRTMTGQGLSEAKHYVEALFAELDRRNNKYPPF